MEPCRVYDRYGRVPLGEKGRIELKAAIRTVLKSKPYLRKQVNEIANLRCATIPQLLHIAALCDLWSMALNISRKFLENKHSKKVQRNCKSNTSPNMKPPQRCDSGPHDYADSHSWLRQRRFPFGEEQTAGDNFSFSASSPPSPNPYYPGYENTGIIYPAEDYSGNANQSTPAHHYPSSSYRGSPSTSRLSDSVSTASSWIPAEMHQKDQVSQLNQALPRSPPIGNYGMHGTPMYKTMPVAQHAYPHDYSEEAPQCRMPVPSPHFDPRTNSPMPYSVDSNMNEFCPRISNEGMSYSTYHAERSPMHSSAPNSPTSFDSRVPFMSEFESQNPSLPIASMQYNSSHDHILSPSNLSNCYPFGKSINNRLDDNNTYCLKSPAPHEPTDYEHPQKWCDPHQHAQPPVPVGWQSTYNLTPTHNEIASHSRAHYPSTYDNMNSPMHEGLESSRSAGSNYQ